MTFSKATKALDLIKFGLQLSEKNDSFAAGNIRTKIIGRVNQATRLFLAVNGANPFPSRVTEWKTKAVARLKNCLDTNLAAVNTIIL